jgi:hypothetical protein
VISCLCFFPFYDRSLALYSAHITCVMLSVLKYFREILFRISLLLPQMKSERWDEEKLESYQPTCCMWSFINIWEEPALPSNVISWHTQKINRICDEVKKKRRSEMALSSNEHKICVNCICFEIKNSVSVYVIRPSLSPSLLPQSFFSRFGGFALGWRQFLPYCMALNLPIPRFREIECRNLHEQLDFDFSTKKRQFAQKGEQSDLIT